MVMQNLARSGRDYLWYGAMYYEKAIQTLKDTVSQHQDDAFAPSPTDSDWAMARPRTGCDSAATSGDTSETRLLAACILCQYEQISATMRAWGGHIDGIYRLMHLSSVTQDLQRVSPLPYPVSAYQSLFWCFAMKDLEESCECINIDGRDLS